MLFFQNSCNQLHYQQPVKLIRKCLRKVSQKAKDTRLQQLKQEKEQSKLRQGKLAIFRQWLADLRYNIFLNPKIGFWFSLDMGIGYFLFTFVLVLSMKYYWLTFVISFLLWFSYLFIWLIISIFLSIVTPKISLEWYQRWQEVKKLYIEELQCDVKSAKKVLKYSIDEYSRRNRWLIILWPLISTGIFLSCIVDSEFQKALFTVLFSGKFLGLAQTNFLGFVATTALPIVGFLYLIKYYTPVITMKNVLTLIEREEDN